jgi:multiple inositol-polyphosphate phosphatase/2,3-bisphosphoglycerate 3-phosphatase
MQIENEITTEILLLIIAEIFTIYSMCRYDLVWNPEIPSAWCLLFNKEELKIIEFSEDLSYYYICGPGRKLSRLLGCHSLSNMFHYFK